MSNEQYGFVISGFSIAYMLCNPLWGRIVDRVGVRPSMTGAVLLWTLASVSHAVAGGVRGFLSLALIRNASAQTAGAKVECASRGIFDKGEF